MESGGTTQLDYYLGDMENHIEKGESYLHANLLSEFLKRIFGELSVIFEHGLCLQRQISGI